MQTDVVTGMYEQGAAGFYTAGKTDGIVQQLMAVVRLANTQGVDHQHFRPLDIVDFRIIDGLHVGDVGK